MDFSSISLSDWISIASIIVSFIASMIAIVISTASLVQNRNILKETNAPKLVMYANHITTGFHGKYIVVKNYGNTETKILDIKFEGNLHELDQKFLNSLKGTTIYPGQIISNGLIEEKNFGNENVQIALSYTIYGKSVNESFLLDFNRLDNTFYLKSGNKSHNEDLTVRAIENLNLDLNNIAHTFDKKNL
ncbi:hypothetical protein [Enterococcus hirae]|uniref:hypothetical protein n=1 Tax=Enterococcus hirae TaxID=1354 RepID=UPI001F061160|nr:hypothetical protein [Enterococcus hirae]MCH1649492.1 hypothetical protein [Enterococcus hirae]MDD9145300.1 hypothetical protein [Enterococcus hirae]